MEKIIEKHLVGFGSLRDLEHLEADYCGEFTDAGMSESNFIVDKSIPSKEECDIMCAELSGDVITYNLKDMDS